MKLVASRDPKDVILTLFNEALAVTSELQSAIHTLQADNDRMVDERSKALKVRKFCILCVMKTRGVFSSLQLE